MSVTFKDLALATRPMFVPASVLPVLVGTAWGWREAGSLHFFIFLAALAGVICLHFGANVINDVGDDLNGCDAINHDRIGPFTGGSRFIQNGKLTRLQMFSLGVGLLLAGGLIGVLLTLIKGDTVLTLGVLGGTLAIAYSLPPFSLASRGFGEATIAIAFGLPAWACAWLQSEQFGLSTLCAACAIGCWTANILIANEIPDIKADQQSGKRTLVVRLRPDQVRLMYIGVAGMATASTFFSGMIALAPLWTIIPPLLLFGVSALVPIKQEASRDQMTTAIRMTLALHLVGGLWLIILAAIA